MGYKDLASLEERVKNTGNNGEYKLHRIAIPVAGESLTLQGLLCTPVNRSGYYYAVAHPKERILLHFTAGNIRSDLSALTTHNRHVSVPFVIGRNGTIYQLFSSKFWSGNIGKGIGNTDTGNAQDKATISIELSNYGYLTKRNNNLETYYSRQKDRNGNEGRVDVYCSLDDKDAYVRLPTPFRGQSYYATYTEAQYNSLIILLRYLTAKYGIPRQFFPENERYNATENVLRFKGIVTHVNYRPDGKWDIGPAFDWNKVMTGVQAQTYEPTVSELESMELEQGIEEGRIETEEGLERYLPAGKNPDLEDESYDEVPVGEKEVETNESNTATV